MYSTVQSLYQVYSIVRGLGLPFLIFALAASLQSMPDKVGLTVILNGSKSQLINNFICYSLYQNRRSGWHN